MEGGDKDNQKILDALIKWGKWNDKGKAIERWWRKATGLRLEELRVMTAGLPNPEVPSKLFGGGIKLS